MKGTFKNIISLVLILSVVMAFVSGATFAYYSWQTSEEQKTEVVFTVEKEFSCAADGGGDITSDDIILAPAGCTNSKYAIQREIKVIPTLFGQQTVLMNLWLDINEIGQGLSNSVNFKYALTTESDSCTDGVVFSGNFYGKQAGDNVTILNNTGYTRTTVETYYLYVWLDSNETSRDTMLQEFDLSINGICTNAPEPQTYVAFNPEDGSLRLSKKNVDEVSNGNINSTPYVSSLNNQNVETVGDVTAITEDSVIFDLEKTKYSSAEQLPWYEYRDQITKIIIEDEIFPISTAYWFKDLKNVTYVDLSKLNTSKVTDMTHMFSGMSSLTNLNLSHFDTSNVTSMEYMFYKCSSLVNLDLSAFNTSKVTSMRSMFSYSSIEHLDLRSFDTSKVSTMSFMFYYCSNLKYVDLSSFNTPNLINIDCMFEGCASLISLDLSNFDTSNVTNMSYLFYECNSLTSLNLTNFNTAKVTEMMYMFNGCSKLVTLDVSGFNTSKVTTMERMFQNCSSLTNLDLSNFNTSKVTNMYSMFSDSSKLITLDISGFNTSKVTNMDKMFRNNSKLTTIFVSSNWTTSAVTTSVDMFKSCTSLKGGAGTKFNSSYIDKTYARIDGGTSSPGYFTLKSN